jgi:hypothetical protein
LSELSEELIPAIKVYTKRKEQKSRDGHPCFSRLEIKERAYKYSPFAWQQSAPSSK